MSISTLASLDNAAAEFHLFPCRATAARYEALAIVYYTNMIIAMDELENILWLVLSYLETKQGPLA